ncbi:IS110 family RNA-guided transposase [Amycolatopsis thermoflava]|uniref:IS110 family transposase n=1 Tax=Amycolatopsis thermoflava TaxID=84480 RepID=UPI00364E2DC6
MPMLADLVDAVIGVDTHRDTHQVELAAPNGAPIATCSIPNTSAGHAQLLTWIGEHAPGARIAASIEGTRSYGRGLARTLTTAGLTVIECEQPNRKARRGKGKSDQIDAHLAVLAALQQPADRLPTPRADGDREALRILLCARNELATAATANTNRLRALLRDGDDHDRALARGRLSETTLHELARRNSPRNATREHVVRYAEIRRLAHALNTHRRELKNNAAQLDDIVNDVAPALISQPGIGAVTAAQVIVSFSHVGRCHNEAAFAKLAGTSPLEASSGRTTRHRLNRNGDRALNSAIHTIALTRMRCCPTTRAYTARRIAEGKTTREVRRCLKRYIARQLYRCLTNTMATPEPTDRPKAA